MLGNLVSEAKEVQESEGLELVLKHKGSLLGGLTSGSSVFHLRTSHVYSQSKPGVPSQSLVKRHCFPCQQRHLHSSAPLPPSISLASQRPRLQPNQPVCFQCLTSHTWQASGTLNTTIIWLMGKLFSISGNKYFWLIMTGGKGLKIHLLLDCVDNIFSSL